MRQKIGRRQGRYYIVCDVYQSESGEYRPMYSIFDGEPISKKLIKGQDLPEPGRSYPTAEQAIENGLALATAWLALNRVE